MGSSTIPLSCPHSPTFSSQLGCLPLSDPLPCGHFQCTAGLSAFVRSLTLWSLSVHSWIVCFCQVPYPVVTFMHSWTVCFCQVPYPVVTFSAQLGCLPLSGPFPCGHFQCTAGLSAFVRSLTLWSLSCTAGLSAFVRSLTLWSLSCTAGLSAFVRSLSLWSLSVHSWTVCFCQVLTLWSLSCTAGLSAFVRSLTLWSLLVHSWAVCFCQVPYPVVTISAQLDCLLLSGHSPCSHFQCTAESGKPCDDCHCFCHTLTMWSLSLHSWPKKHCAPNLHTLRILSELLHWQLIWALSRPQ